MNSTPSIDTYTVVFYSAPYFQGKKEKSGKYSFSFLRETEAEARILSIFFFSIFIALYPCDLYVITVHNDPAGLKPGTAASAVWLNFKYSMTPIQYLKDDADSSHQKKLYCTYSLSCTLSTQLPLPGG